MVKKGELKEAVKEVFTHHKKHVVLYVIELVVIIALIAVLVMQKDVALRGVVVNTSDSAPNEAYSKLSEDLLLGTRLDPSKKKVELMSGVYYILSEDDPESESKNENNYTFIQALVKQTDEGNMDFMTGDLKTMTNLAYSSFFVELTEVLSEEQLKLYEPYLLYIDLAVVEQIKKAGEASDYDAEIIIPDCTKPEDMEKPVAILIDMSECESLAALYPDVEGPIVFSVMENTKHKGTLKTLIESLLEK